MDFVWIEAKQVSCLIQATNSIASNDISQSTFGLNRFFFMFAKSKSLKIVLDRTHTHLCIKEEEGCLPCMRWFTFDVDLPITQFTLRTSFRFSLFFAILQFCMCVFFFLFSLLTIFLFFICYFRQCVFIFTSDFFSFSFDMYDRVSVLKTSMKLMLLT